jgi:hypothetical protein
MNKEFKLDLDENKDLEKIIDVTKQREILAADINFSLTGG